MVFSSRHVWMWKLDYKESWALKNWCFWSVVLEKTLESHLDYKKIQSGNPKGKQSWIFIGRTDAEAKTPILWLPDAKNWLIWKDPGSGRLKAGEGDNRGWDGWMPSPTQWTWVWVNSVSWWWTGSPGMLQSMGSQIVGHKWVNWTELNRCPCLNPQTLWICHLIRQKAYWNYRQVKNLKTGDCLGLSRRT